MGYLLAVMRSLISGVTTVFNKNYMTNTKDMKHGFNIYMLILYPIAMIFYFFMAGCDVAANMPTLLFAVVYAVVSIACNFCGMVGMNFATIVYLNVFAAAGGTIILFIYELIFTSASFSAWKITSVVLRILAVGIPLLFTRGEKSMTKKGFIICIAYFIVSGLAGVVSRMYVSSPNVMSDGSFFFWTNVFIMPIAFFDIFRKSNVKALVADAKTVGLKNYLYVIGTAVIGNLATFLSLEIVRQLGGTVSSIISGSLMMIITALVSAVIYKESMSRQSLISVMLSIAAVILSVF